tara:strand:- start:8931 stop:9110 length:180 start_codon:yes stop_codon:yes gene_type:complete
MKDDVRAFQKNLMELVVFSDGMISYNDMWMLTYDEREMFFEVVKQKLDAKAGKKQPEML